MTSAPEKKEAIEKRDQFPLWMGLILCAACIGVLAAMSFVYFVYPHIGIGPEQPIPFSHRVHAGVKRIDCRFCHPFVERSIRAGIPAMSKCLFCHSYIITGHPEIVKVRASVVDHKPVPWIRIFWIPDHVQFNHQPHINAGFDCARCHGDVETRDRLIQVDFQMGFCVRCHQEYDANLDCWLSCHKS